MHAPGGRQDGHDPAGRRGGSARSRTRVCGPGARQHPVNHRRPLGRARPLRCPGSSPLTVLYVPTVLYDCLICADCLILTVLHVPSSLGARQHPINHRRPLGRKGCIRCPGNPRAPDPTPYTLHSTPYTLHPAYSTPYTLHPAPYTLHPTPCIASLSLSPTLYTHIPHSLSLSLYPSSLSLSIPHSLSPSLTLSLSRGRHVLPLSRRLVECLKLPNQEGITQNDLRIFT